MGSLDRLMTVRGSVEDLLKKALPPGVADRLPRVACALFFPILFAWIIWESLFGFGQSSSRSAVFPLAIGIPALMLALGGVALELRSRGQRHENVPIEVEPHLEDAVTLEPGVERRRTIAAMAWIIGFYLAIWLLGFMIAAPLITLLYLRIAGKEGWPIAVAGGVFSWLFFDGLFDGYLHIPLSERLDGLFVSKIEEFSGAAISESFSLPATWLVGHIMALIKNPLYFDLPVIVALVSILLVRRILRWRARMSA